MRHSACCIFPGKIGDALFFLSSIYYIQKTYATDNNIDIDWVYGSSTLDEMVKFLPMTDIPIRNYIPYKYGYPGDCFEWKKIDWKEKFPGYDSYHNCTMTEAPRNMHLIDWIPFRAGLTKDTKLTPIHFEFDREMVKTFGSRSNPESPILLHPWIPFPERCCKWLLKLHPEYNGHKIVSIGHKTEPMLEGSIDGRGRPYMTYLGDILNAKLVVGVSSSWTTWSAVMGIPTIVVHTGTLPLHCGMGTFGPHAVDMFRPFLYDIERKINELSSLSNPNPI